MENIPQETIDSIHEAANEAFFNVSNLSGDPLRDREPRENAICAIINVRKHLEEAGLKHSVAYLTETAGGGI